jgi:hypothetical protein
VSLEDKAPSSLMTDPAVHFPEPIANCVLLAAELLHWSAPTVLWTNFGLEPQAARTVANHL